MSFLDDSSSSGGSSSEGEGKAKTSTRKLKLGASKGGDDEMLQVNEKFAKRYVQYRQGGCHAEEGGGMVGEGGRSRPKRVQVLRRLRTAFWYSCTHVGCRCHLLLQYWPSYPSLPSILCSLVPWYYADFA